jgi:predicted Na+-dependent transporter
MDLNKMVSKAGSVIVTVTVFLFAIFLIINFSFGYYFVCLILPIGFIMMTAGLNNECEEDRKAAANIGLILAAVYSTFIMFVYFTQLTTVINEQLNEQATNLLKFDKFGFIFNFDLLGYGVMALSTFFTGLSMKSKNKTDKWLRALLMIHGVFYFSCTFMPITGMFAKMSSNGDGIGGRLALVAWCVYFLPIGILSYFHFNKSKMSR